MPYTEAQKTKLLLIGLIHRPTSLAGLPVELQADAAALISKIDNAKLKAAAKAINTKAGEGAVS